MKRIVILIAGMLLVSTAAFAMDMAPGTIDIQGASTFNYSSMTVSPDGGGDMDVSLMNVNFTAAYYLMPNIGIGGILGYQNGEVEDSSVSAMTIGAMGKYNYSLNPKTSLFGDVALGYISVTVDASGLTDTGGSEDITGFFWQLGGGVKYFITDAFSLDGLAMYQSASLSDGGDVTISGFSIGAGFSIYIK